MAVHLIEPEARTVHGHFSRELRPVVTIKPGDTVRFRTLDASWATIEQADPYARPKKFEPRDLQRDPGHALCGPVAIRGARPGMTLAVHLRTIRTGSWGWSSAGGFASAVNRRLGLAEGAECVMRWALDPAHGTARDSSGRIVQMRPFLGVMGMPPDQPGSHSTIPPRFCGGNIDCKELVEGSVLYLPVPVEGGLFSLGDGHALQGDGEVAGPALECPMEAVEVEFQLHERMRLSMPRASTPAGWITFGFHEDLNEASMVALEGMLDLLMERHRVERKEALALASLVVDLRITQVVNGVRGVHAVLSNRLLDGGGLPA